MGDDAGVVAAARVTKEREKKHSVFRVKLIGN